MHTEGILHTGKKVLYQYRSIFCNDIQPIRKSNKTDFVKRGSSEKAEFRKEILVKHKCKNTLCELLTKFKFFKCIKNNQKYIVYPSSIERNFLFRSCIKLVQKT